MDFVAIAERIATDAHRGQVDKSGADYIEHPRRVAARLDTQEQKATAWLHDVLEDTEVTPSDLLANGIPLNVVVAVQLLTRGGSGDYFDTIRGNPVALAVKLADIADNSDEARLAQLDPPTQQRLRMKYATALAALT